MPRILLVDAYSQIFRLFYALPPQAMSNHRGEPTNALFGMAKLLLQLDREFPTEYGALVFDHGKCRRRTALLPEYKAQRPPMPQELRDQVPRIRQWADAFGWPLLEREGVEADDLLAAISRQRDACSVTILTADKDLGQLVQDGQVQLMRPEKGGKWNLYGEKEIQEKYGVPPRQLRDYLALLGDTADNIRGIPGCGPKTAARLLAQWDSIDGILEHWQELPPGKLKDTLQQEREHLLQNRELVQLDNLLPESWRGLETIRRLAPDWTRLASLCQQEDFQSLRETIQRHTAPRQLTLDLGLEG
ncbi:MAG: 5'-3' exonuclease H3TH domain-containing protein [Oligosphaeraceae bacterium]